MANRVPAYVTDSSFTNCRTLLFFNKYAHEHTFSVSWVREATLKNYVHVYFETICPSDVKTNDETCFSFHVLCPSSYKIKSYYSF